MDRRLGIILIVLVSFSLEASFAPVGAEVTPLELVFTVYSDGVVEVDYYVEADPTKAREDVALYGSLIEDLLATDQDGLPLEATLTPTGITVDTLGATNLRVTYLTPDMTWKTGAIWGFNATTPITTRIDLPQGATIVDLSDIPLALGNQDGRPYVTMPAGGIHVAYTIEITDPREEALILINDAEFCINNAKNEGIMLSEAENLLQQARSAFDQEKYPEAGQLAQQAKQTATSTVEDAQGAEDMIDVATTAITNARAGGRTKGLESAESLLAQAEASYGDGDYPDALSLATQARDTALQAASPSGNLLLVAGGGIAILVVLAVVYLKMTKKPPEAMIPRKPVDLDLVFEKHPGLRMDDKEVIRFLAESGGEVFANEIRERFDIPRTSAWRLIRRLVNMGILEERKVGGQSLVSVQETYRRG